MSIVNLVPLWGNRDMSLLSSSPGATSDHFDCFQVIRVSCDLQMSSRYDHSVADNRIIFKQSQITF